jgi:hypothetical protein
MNTKPTEGPGLVEDLAGLIEDDNTPKDASPRGQLLAEGTGAFKDAIEAMQKMEDQLTGQIERLQERARSYGPGPLTEQWVETDAQEIRKLYVRLEDTQAARGTIEMAAKGAKHLFDTFGSSVDLNMRVRNIEINQATVTAHGPDEDLRPIPPNCRCEPVEYCSQDNTEDQEQEE